MLTEKYITIIIIFCKGICGIIKKRGKNGIILAKNEKSFFIFSLFIIFLSRIIYPVLNRFYIVLTYNDYAFSVAYFILPISFSILLGCMNFSNKRKFTSNDFSSNYKNFFTIYFSGISILIFLVLISMISFLPFKVKYDLISSKKI